MLPDRGPEEERGGLGQGEGEEEGGEQTVHTTASWEWPHCTGRRCSNTGVLSIFLPAYHNLTLGENRETGQNWHFSLR